MSNKFKLLGILLVISLLAVPLMGCAKGLTLTISEPKGGATFTESPVRVSGTVSDPEATVTVNNVEVEVKGGILDVAPTPTFVMPFTFSADVELTEAENTITVVATLGEETVTRTVTVTYVPLIHSDGV